MDKKTHTLAIEVPHDLYEDLAQEARSKRRKVKDVVVGRLRLKKAAKPRRSAGLSPALLKYLGAFKGGDPRGSDNEKIDADIARELMNNHELERLAGQGRRRVGASRKGPPRISPQLERVLGIFKGGDPRAGDNERIDADLMREAETGLRKSRR